MYRVAVLPLFDGTYRHKESVIPKPATGVVFSPPKDTVLLVYRLTAILFLSSAEEEPSGTFVASSTAENCRFRLCCGLLVAQ